MNAIETRGLTKRYGQKTAVDALDLTVEEGELFALLGVNGAGKTTTIKMLSCLSTQTDGDAYLMGMSVRENPAGIKQIIGVSPQETAVAPNLTVRENLMLMAGVHGFKSEQAKAKTEQMMKEFSLDTVQKQRAKTLSGGWQRRLSIAMALISEPKILFLDEPTLGLDVLARHELWNIVTALKGKVTIILTTHYLEEAEAISDRICVMKDGKIRASGTAASLTAQAGTKNFEDAFVKLVTEEGQNKGAQEK